MNELSKPFPKTEYEWIKTITKTTRDKRVSIQKHTKTGKLFIIKKMNEINNVRDSVLLEIEIGKKLDHPNFAKTYESYYQEEKSGEGKHYLVIQYIDGIKLSDFISNHKSNAVISFAEFKSIITQLFKSVIYCLEQDVCPLDLNDRNLLIDSANKITLIDFGCYRKAPYWMFVDMGHGLKNYVLDISRITRLPDLENLENKVKYDKWEQTLRFYQKLDTKEEHIQWCNDLLKHPFLA